jgi:hypothetical protein
MTSAVVAPEAAPEAEVAAAAASTKRSSRRASLAPTSSSGLMAPCDDKPAAAEVTASCVSRQIKKNKIMYASAYFKAQGWFAF